MRNRKGRFFIYFAAIRADKRQLYRFLFTTPTRNARAMVRRMDQTVESFRRLSTRAAGKLKPLRIRVHTVRRGDTVAKLVDRMGVAKEPKRLFEVLNARSPNQPLQVGERVKLITR